MSFKQIMLLIVIVLGIGFSIFPKNSHILAQPRITNTPLPVVIPDIPPTATPQASGNNSFVEASPSPTFTPTQPLPDARLISVAASGTALIRDFPENGAVVGVLQDNTEYQILGQYISWYKIQLGSSPQAWVYFEDIRIIGDATSIPAVDPNAQTQLSEQDIATTTALALFQTPGFAETATAEARILELPQEEIEATGPTSEFPATYTPPAEIVQLQATAIPNVQATAIPEIDIIAATRNSVLAGNIPPILPIVGLTVFGILGMLIAAVRR